MSLDIPANSSVSKSIVPSGDPGPRTEGPESKKVIIEILKQLGELGISSWDKLDIAAKKSGISDPQAVLAHFSAMEKLQSAGYGNAQQRDALIISALIQNSHLPAEDLMPLCQTVGRLSPANCKTLVEGHLEALGCSSEAIEFWTAHFIQGNNEAPAILPYLALIGDKELFESKALGFPGASFPLAISLCSLHTEDGAALFSPNEISQFTQCNVKMKVPLLIKFAEEPELCLRGGSFYGLKDPAVFLEKCGELEDEVPESLPRALLALHLTSESKGMTLKELEIFFKELTSKDLLKFSEYVLKRPHELSRQTIELITTTTGMGWRLESVLKPPDQNALINQMINTAVALPGLSVEASQQLLAKLFGDNMNFLNALILYKGLYSLDAGKIGEFSHKESRGALLAEVTPCILKLGLSSDESTFPASYSKALIKHLPPEILKSCVCELHALALAGSPHEKAMFAKVFEGNLSDITVQKELFLNHLSRLECSRADIEQWEIIFNQPDAFAGIPPKVRESAILSLPFLTEKDAFQKDLNAVSGPINSFLGRVMKLEGKNGTPNLLEMKLNEFLGIDRRNSRGSFRILKLALENPKFLNALRDYNEYGKKVYDMDEIERGFQLFGNPKIALAWATASGVDQLTSSERAELLQQMQSSSQIWKNDVVMMLTATDTNTFEDSDADSLLEKVFQAKGLGPQEIAACKAAISSPCDSENLLMQKMLPYLMSASSEEIRALDFSASEDKLFISFLIAILKKKPPEPFAAITAEKLSIIDALPNRISLKFNTALTALPQETATILSDLCRMSSISLQAEGAARNSWEMYAKAQMKRLDAITNQSDLSQDLASRWQNLADLKPETKPVEWLLELNEGKTREVLGRTHLYRDESTGKILAVKWQKVSEPVGDLFKEQATLEVVRDHQEKLKLQSQFPNPIGVYKFEGELPQDYFGDTTVKTAAAEVGNELVAYIYEFPNNGYFTYLNDPKGPGDLNIEIAKAYSQARQALIVDLFILAKNGLLMTQLADIFHRSEPSRVGRDDGGRFLAMNFLLRNYSLCVMEPGDFEGPGSGRLHHLETAVKYPNAGYSGLRDIGDSELLSDFKNPEFEFNQKHFSQLLKKNPAQATAFILANFLSEYLLVYELIITERHMQSGESTLDWKDPEKVKELENELKEGFINAMRYYSGVSQTVSRRFVENASIDWTKAAKQLHYFHRQDEMGYRPEIPEELFPKEIYGEEVPVAKDPRASISSQELREGREVRHRGAFSGTDPVKEPEKGRVIMMTHMLLLEKARKEARRLLFTANADFYENKGSENERNAAIRVLKLYEESLEYWPFDKDTYKSLADVYTVLGNSEKAQASKEQWAALTMQNAWEDNLRNP